MTNDNVCYFPLIKTRDAEFRCFENIAASDFEKLLPIYELTKSRRSKKDPDGAISKNMRRIEQIQKGSPFILDLTTTSKYKNPQINDLMSPFDGYCEWRRFVFQTHGSLNIIPVIHVNEDPLETGYKELQDFILKSPPHKEFAIRLPIDLTSEEVIVLFDKLRNALTTMHSKVIVLVDAGYVRVNFHNVVDSICNILNLLKSYEDVIATKVALSTSFPLEVAKGKDDHEDIVNIYEEQIYQRIKVKVPDVKYGDYCSVNTEQIERSGGSFIPRIDIASLNGDTFSYKRYRQSEGGYVLCAKRTLEDRENYQNLGTWADDRIKEAAEGRPYRLNPASWLAVRLNYFIKTRLLLRARDYEDRMDGTLMSLFS